MDIHSEPLLDLPHEQKGFKKKHFRLFDAFRFYFARLSVRLLLQLSSKAAADNSQASFPRADVFPTPQALPCHPLGLFQLSWQQAAVSPTQIPPQKKIRIVLQQDVDAGSISSCTQLSVSVVCTHSSVHAAILVHVERRVWRVQLAKQEVEL